MPLAQRKRSSCIPAHTSLGDGELQYNPASPGHGENRSAHLLDRGYTRFQGSLRTEGHQVVTCPSLTSLQLCGEPRVEADLARKLLSLAGPHLACRLAPRLSLLLCRRAPSSRLQLHTMEFLTVALPYFTLTNALAAVLTAFLSYVAYSLFLHPLAGLPGPFLGRAGLGWMTLRGVHHDMGWTLQDEHRKHGLVVRVARNMASVVDPAAVNELYRFGGKFEKTRWVANLSRKCATSRSLIISRRCSFYSFFRRLFVSPPSSCTVHALTSCLSQAPTRPRS